MKKFTSATLLALAFMQSVPANSANEPDYRTVEIQTREATSPALTISPDGRTLVFTILGHLFRMSTDGGTATQITLGPSYNYDPAFSPDGQRIAFISDRDGGDANVFVLELASGKVTQLSHVVDANRPAWSPDGRTVAFASNLPREGHPLEEMPGFGDYYLRDVKTVPADGGAETTIATARHADALFYLPDGRLAWSDRDGGGGGMRGGPQVTQTQVQARGPDGSVAELVKVGANMGRAVPSSKGDGVYYVLGGRLQWLPFAANATPAAGISIQGGARLSLAQDGSAVYFGQQGGLWKAALPSGEPQPIPFTAAVKMSVRPHVEKPWKAPAQRAGRVALRAVLAPSVSPDGKRIAVVAGGFLYEQPIAGGPAQRLVEGRAFVRDPAYSPDGRQIAFVASENGQRYLRLYDFGTRKVRNLFATGGAQWPLYPAWSPDSRQIVFQHAQNLGAPFPIVVVNVSDGSTREVVRTVGSWVARPQFSADGLSLYFTNRDRKVATFNRISLQDGATPAALTDFTRHAHEVLVSPDGKWMAQRRNSEIWVAPLSSVPVRDGQLRKLSSEGGRSFTFTPDSSAIVYAAGGKLYREPVPGGRSTPLPVNITITREITPPLLVSRIRALDFATNRFSDETSMLIENGRISWIGNETGRRIPAGVVRLDGAGRYAIPGLIDLHVHSGWANVQANEDAFIAFGVTTVRDTGGQLDVLTALRDRSENTLLPAPRYFYSGEIFEGRMPYWGDAFYEIGSEAEARAEVRNLAKWGADYIKIYPSVPFHLQAAITDEAHRQGLPNVGHGILYQELVSRLIWGAKSLEHGTPVTGSYDDVRKMLVATKTVADLTLSVGGGGLMRAQDPDWQSDWRVKEYVPAEAQSVSPGMGATGSREALLAGFKPMFDRILLAQEEGVDLGAGTDALMGGVFFGLNFHWEIAQFADAGLAPIDVLRIATVDAAKLVGAANDLGSLTPGKLGDVVLLDANPLENIRNTRSIWQVIKGGEVYDPRTMRQGTSAQ